MTLINNNNFSTQNNNKIILVIISGLGGIQSGPNMLTELQQAHKPNLNALARKSICGMIHPVSPGIIPKPSQGLSHLLGYSVEKKKRYPSFHEKYGLHACLISNNPLYGTMCSSLGINIKTSSNDPATSISLAEEFYTEYNFFIVHFTTIDDFGRQKDYYEKVKAIETLDTHIAKLTALQTAVLSITSDYSFPTALTAISWHPVPILINAQNCRYDNIQSFDEIACSCGGLGIMRAIELMPLLLANAGMAEKAVFNV